MGEKKRRRRILTMLLTLCLVFAELGTYSVTADAAGSTLKISSAGKPGTLKKGSSWTCTGTISSNYTLTNVSGYILDSKGASKYSKSVTPNKTSYSLAGGAIDKALLFNKLAAGTYTYKITAKDKSGKSATLVESKFTVTEPASTLAISSAGKPGTLKKGASWTCTGTISSNYAITNVSGYIIGSDGKTKYSKSTAPNKTSYSLSGSAIDSALSFNKLAVGSYTYKITAKDKSGKSATLVESKFTVTEPTSTLTISSAGSPGTLNKGASWTCTGTISSNYAITNVSGYIIGSDGKTKYSKSAAPNKTSYSLSGSAIDSALSFNKLAVGSYTYKITAKDKSGKSATLVESKFTVTQPTSTLKISNAGSPGTLIKGASWTCTGTISSNYAVTNVSGYIIGSDGKTKYSKSAAPNKTSYSLSGSAIDSALAFNKLAVGSYTYKITAKDKSGKEATLVNEKFEVKNLSTSVVNDGDYIYLEGYQNYCTGGENSIYCQKNSRYSDEWKDNGCMACSYGIAYSIIYGKAKDPLRYGTASTGYAKDTDGKFDTSTPKYDAATVYSKIKSGQPVLVKIAADSGGKHWVTAVGVKKTSTPKTLKVSEIIVIDPVDGNKKTLQQALNSEKGSGWKASQIKYLK